AVLHHRPADSQAPRQQSTQYLAAGRDRFAVAGPHRFLVRALTCQFGGLSNEESSLPGACRASAGGTGLGGRSEREVHLAAIAGGGVPPPLRGTVDRNTGQGLCGESECAL